MRGISMATASITNPVYTANLFISDGTKYVLSGITTDLVISCEKNEIAEKVNITFANVKVGGKHIHSNIQLRDKLYVYANTGSGAKEVFRGIVWERDFSFDDGKKSISLICYDKLIYLQNSKDNLYVKNGSNTKNILTNLAKKWGIEISYKYQSITHEKIVYRSEYIADIFVDILEKVKKKTGVGYVIRCEKGVMVIESEQSNSTVYKIESGDNAISTSYNETMSGMVTKVQIVKAEKEKKGDKEEETGRYITVTNVTGETSKYGTLQDIIEQSSDEKLDEAKKEANQIISDKGKPEKEITITAVDNPWIKKGHQVYINSGTMNNYYIVKGIEHDATIQEMTLEVKKA